MKITLTVVIGGLLFASIAGAQGSSNGNPGRNGGSTSPSDTTAPAAESDAGVEQVEAQLPRSPWSFGAGVSTVLDTNVNRNDENLDAYGGVVGLGAKYRRELSRSTFEFEYEAARHEYTRIDKWDRISQRARGMIEREFADRWTAGLVAEVSLKGSSEDRNVGDQYALEPSVEYELTDQNKLGVYSSMQLRRYANPGENAFYHDTGVEFTQEIDDDREWGIEIRFENNQEQEAEGRYQRWRWATKYVTELTDHDEVEFELEFRTREYTDRFVEIEDEDVLRRDHRIVPSVAWGRELWGGLGLLVEYEFEARYSNDPDKSFNGHQVIVGLAHWW